MCLKVTEHGMRNGVPSPVAPVMMPPHREQNQLLRILHRQQPQQDLIQERENGRVRPDSERQGHRRHRHIARTAPQSTQGILEIAHRRSRPLVQAHPSGSPPIGSLQDYAFVYDRPGACPGLTRKPDKKVIACDGASRCAHALEVGEFGLT